MLSGLNLAMSRGSAPGERRGGRQKGTPNKRTVAKLMDAGRAIADTKKMDSVRAKNVLSDLTKTAVGFAAHYQQKMMAFDGTPENAGKLVPQEIVDRFMAGLNTAIRAATALAPYQDPKLSAIKVSMSPFDVPEVPKVIDGKATKIDLKDPIELARIYHSLVRAA